MDNLIELAKGAPLTAILWVAIFALLPCIARIVESICGLIFNLALLLAFAIKGKNQQGYTFKSDFHGAKFEIRKSSPKDEGSLSVDDDGTKEEEPSTSLSGKVTNIKDYFKRGQ